MKRFTSLEERIDAAAHGVLDRLPAHGVSGALVEFLVFGLKQGWACLFGGAMLFLIIATKYLPPDGLGLARYDFLFLAAIAIQLSMLAFKLETLSEAKVILIFHIVGTAMEIFKTHAGSWIYPEENFFRIGGVPLFSGFMYAAVGSYLARISRIFDMRYTNYPPLPATVLLAAAIYVNFFAHHFVADMRYVLFGATARSISAPSSTTASSAFATGCRCCSASCWSRCSSGSPKTSAHGRGPGSIPDRMPPGRQSRSRNSAPGIS